ncbi:hypothetical protein DICPUDRAFT_99460 [Dictyostelium purpureum]|uniref:Uncharacterized protein n=1 Tax=Dictyostelium purpureum TaxID=5786 RepID=F0ZZC8_DICPU|nr:uncharacterized protein DICPUDRAFT_99460 [Dictyostelium purpureum]EGC30710.1 hypothetical protein DICPUDRAFT_99460 [Dictyostelium purpureum]|eukprot:XP_003292773.1 hypothetical protein DICPUDRAFT_99460 [Dictyostelium purpureum]
MQIKKILFLLNIFLIFNSINSFEFLTVQFEKSDCSGIPIVIYSTTQCSPAGYFNVEGTTVHVTIENNIKSVSDCKNPIKDYEDTLNKCNSNGLKTYFNKDYNVSLPEGYCAEVRLLQGGDCENNLELISYKDGVCINDGSNIYHRYLCDGNVAKRYKCASDCTKTVDKCVFDKVLDSIEKCPSIKTKSIKEITNDSSIKTPAPTKPNENGSSNNGTNTGGNNNSNTGSATTGGNNSKGGDNGNHSTILNINIVFISFLSLLLLLK